MSSLVLTVFLGPLLAAAVAWLLPGEKSRRGLAIGTALAMTLASFGLLVEAASGAVTVLSFGGWNPPLGISFQADRLAALFLCLLSLVLLATFLSLPAAGRRVVGGALFLAAALAGAFLTADLFNLFVMFELVLVSSYLLLQASADKARRASAPYVVMNVLASLLFFVGVGMLYALGGSLDLAQLTVSLAEVRSPWKAVGVGLLALAFATKAGIVPLMFWLPRTYPHLAGPLAALFAGLMTKLGVYALLRTAPLMAATPLPEALLWAGALSSLLAVLAAQAQTRFRRLLSFHVVSQVGFILVGVGLASIAGIAGAVLYLAHHVLVKTALFLTVDALGAEPRGRPGGSREQAPSPALRGAFLLAGLSLAGLPPLSGFLGKVAVLTPLVGASRPVVTAILLAASIFTLASVLKIWTTGFSPPSDGPIPIPAGRRHPPLGAGLLVAASLILAVAAGPAFDFARATAEQLLEPVTSPMAGIGP